LGVLQSIAGDGGGGDWWNCVKHTVLKLESSIFNNLHLFSVGAKFETAIPIKAETGATQFATHDTKDRPLTVLGHVEWADSAEAVEH